MHWTAHGGGQQIGIVRGNARQESAPAGTDGHAEPRRAARRGRARHVTVNEQAKKVRDPLRSLHIARRTALLLLSAGVGLVIFGVLPAVIVQVREVLAVSAVGVVNRAIGAGLLIDYSMQRRELARFCAWRWSQIRRCRTGR